MYFNVANVNETTTKEWKDGLGIITHHVCDLVSTDGAYKIEGRVMEFIMEGKPFQYSIMYTYWKDGKVLNSDGFSYSPEDFKVGYLEDVVETHLYEINIHDIAHKFATLENK
jgi:hypothetical protein